jgi:hypothetical protein
MATKKLTQLQQELLAKVQAAGPDTPMIIIDDDDWPGWSDEELKQLFGRRMAMTVDAVKGEISVEGEVKSRFTPLGKK